MRLLASAASGRTAAFFRDVLGFEVRQQEDGVEAVYGPVRIRFGADDYAPGEWDAPRPPGSAILFFQTDDVTAMHTAIRNRGGSPSEIEKVNWIKMRMFEVRDPDGHALWFGQSYDRPESAHPRPMMQKALPMLPFDDVAAAVVHYRDVLGFHVNYQQEGLGVMDRDEVTVLLVARTDELHGAGAFEVYVENADALYAELCAKGARVEGEPASRPWGLRDFRVRDLEGNQIIFAQPFE